MSNQEFQKELDLEVEKFNKDLEYLEDFYKFVSKNLKNLKNTIEENTSLPLTDNDKKILQDYDKSQINLLKGINEKVESNVDFISIQNIIKNSLELKYLELLEFWRTFEKHLDFIRYMTIVHIVALWESFVKAYLFIVLKHIINQPSSGVNNFSSLTLNDKILQEISSNVLLNQIYTFGKRFPYNAHKFINRNFNINIENNFTKLKELKKLKECRNKIVHDITSLEFDKENKTSSGKMENAIVIDDSYMFESIKNVKCYLIKFHTQFKEKLF